MMQLVHGIVRGAGTAAHPDDLQPERACVARKRFSDRADADEHHRLAPQIMGQRSPTQWPPLALVLALDVTWKSAGEHEKPCKAGLRDRLGIRTRGARDGRARISRLHREPAQARVAAIAW